LWLVGIRGWVFRFQVFSVKIVVLWQIIISFHPFAVLEMVFSRVFVIGWKILATEILSARKTAFKGKVKLSV
jgi:hypothetical protein